MPIYVSQVLFCLRRVPGAHQHHSLDDPELWKNQPITVQLVKPQFEDEELIAVAEVIDGVCNA